MHRCKVEKGPGFERQGASPVSPPLPPPTSNGGLGSPPSLPPPPDPPTSRMLGMMSAWHCLRNRSLSKLGSTRRISVRTSDISVLEKRPPARGREEGAKQGGSPDPFRREGGGRGQCRSPRQPFLCSCPLSGPPSPAGTAWLSRGGEGARDPLLGGSRKHRGPPALSSPGFLNCGRFKACGLQFPEFCEWKSASLPVNKSGPAG